MKYFDICKEENLNKEYTNKEEIFKVGISILDKIPLLYDYKDKPKNFT